ncbi:MAG TPA: hypothetical protein PKD61_17950, partial [Polyangiaceae bacterium]|nr:hypothetical protein [Polyangiaceae bacterium]
GATDGSAGTADGASTAGGGGSAGSGPNCQACVACVQSSCASEITACKTDTDCGAIFDCASACGSKTADQCIADNPNGLTKWATVSACLNANCLAKCQ